MSSETKALAKAPRERWIKPRHRVLTALATCVIAPYCRWKCGITVRPFREQGDRQYLVLINHQTAYDQFFVSMAFRGVVYYLATEDIFSNGLISKLLRYAVAPIPIKKQTMDARAVRTCLQLVKEGGTLGLSPEGNRTYSGRTEYMNPAIAKLARRLGLPIALFRIEGGYGVQPRWSDVTRRGRMEAGVTRVIEPEEYAGLSDSQLYGLIQKELYVDESRPGGDFRHPRLAEYLERAFYVCPHCGLSRFESRGDTVTCLTCGRTARYLPNKELQGDFGFSSVGQWYDWQKEYVSRLDLSRWLETPMFRDGAKVSRVVLYSHKETLLENAPMALYGDRVDVGEGKLPLPFSEIEAVTVLGRNKLNIYHGGQVYQFKGGKRFNALKYVNIFYHFKSVEKGEDHEQFLGL